MTLGQVFSLCYIVVYQGGRWGISISNSLFCSHLHLHPIGQIQTKPEGWRRLVDELYEYWHSRANNRVEKVKSVWGWRDKQNIQCRNFIWKSKYNMFQENFGKISIGKLTNFYMIAGSFQINWARTEFSTTVLGVLSIWDKNSYLIHYSNYKYMKFLS